MADQVYGFGAGDVRRISNVVRRVEREPANRPQRRARWPVLGGGTKLIPVQITEREGDLPDPAVEPDVDDRDPVAIYRADPWLYDADDEDSGFYVRRLKPDWTLEEGTADEVCYADGLHGVYCTDDKVLAVKLGGRLYLYNGGVTIWPTALTNPDFIGTSGDVYLWYGGPVVNAEAICGATLFGSQSITVAYHDHHRGVEARFWIIDACCPADGADA